MYDGILSNEVDAVWFQMYICLIISSSQCSFYTLIPHLFRQMLTAIGLVLFASTKISKIVRDLKLWIKIF